MSYGDWANEHGLIGLGLVSGWNPTDAERAQRDATERLNALGGNSLDPLFNGNALTQEQWQEQYDLNQQAQANRGQALNAPDASLPDYDTWVQQINAATGHDLTSVGGVSREAYEAARAQGPQALSGFLSSVDTSSVGGRTQSAVRATAAGMLVAPGTTGAGMGNQYAGVLGDSFEEYQQNYRNAYRDAGLEIEDPALQTLLGRPEMADAASDPRYAQSFDQALSGMEDIYRQGGYTEAERAQMRMAQQDAANFGQSQLEGQLQQLHARGLTGSGIEAMMRGASSQSAANSAARSADQITANGMDRALAAMQQAGAMGSSGRAQSFGEDSARRSAIDNFNAMNTQHQQNVQQRNVDRRYTAAGAQQQQANYGMQQQAADQARIAGTVGAIGSGIAGIYTGGASTAATAAAGAGNKQRRPDPYGTGSY